MSMKCLNKILLPLLMVGMLVGCSAKTPEDNNKETSNSGACGEEAGCALMDPADMDSYESFTNANHIFQKSEMETILTLLREKKSGVVYMGYPKCPWCVEAVPILDEVANAKDKVIYYVETRDAEKNLLYTDEEKAEFITYAEEYLDKDDEGNYAIFVPFVFVIKDGVIESGNIGTVDSHDAHERKMNDEEKAQLKEIYENMLS